MNTQTENGGAQGANWVTWLGIALGVYGILLAVGMVSSGFKWGAGGAEGAKELFAFATNPFTGLLVGMLATALVQSSSTVTSVIVGLVAGGLPVTAAIPMVMGANIGTTITNTLVSLGHVRKKKEFKRAFAAATVHDFFNLIAVLIFLPLELLFGYLEKISYYFAHMLVGGQAFDLKSYNFVKPLIKPVVGAMKSGLKATPLPEKGAAVLLAILGVVLIFVCITALGKLLKRAMVGKAKTALHSAVGRGPLSGIASGAVVTVLVQSSSTTTSLIIPLAGSGIFKLREIYPFTLGANIGTTITALLAAFGATTGAEWALQIALVHLLFNISAVILIYGIPFLRNLPLRGAEWMSEVAAEKKLLALLYVAGVFFAVPALLVAFTAG